MKFSIIRLAVARVVRERVFYPVVGQVADQFLRRLRGAQDWEGVATVASCVMIENITAIGTRAVVAEVIKDIGPYLGSESIEVLQFIREIAVKHSPEAN